MLKTSDGRKVDVKLAPGMTIRKDKEDLVITVCYVAIDPVKTGSEVEYRYEFMLAVVNHDLMVKEAERIRHGDLPPEKNQILSKNKARYIKVKSVLADEILPLPPRNRQWNTIMNICTLLLPYSLEVYGVESVLNAKNEYAEEQFKMGYKDFSFPSTLNALYLPAHLSWKRKPIPKESASGKTGSGGTDPKSTSKPRSKSVHIKAPQPGKVTGNQDLPHTPGPRTRSQSGAIPSRDLSLDDSGSDSDEDTYQPEEDEEEDEDEKKYKGSDKKGKGKGKGSGSAGKGKSSGGSGAYNYWANHEKLKGISRFQ